MEVRNPYGTASQMAIICWKKIQIKILKNDRKLSTAEINN